MPSKIEVYTLEVLGLEVADFVGVFRTREEAAAAALEYISPEDITLGWQALAMSQAIRPTWKSLYEDVELCIEQWTL